MLGNFIYSNPTKLYFGDEAQKNLVAALRGFGKKVLLAYGGGSIKRNGIYDDVMAALNEAEKEVVELSSVMPNPTLAKMKEGVEIVRSNNIDFILAVGGGSTIDYAKAVSASAGYDGDAWQHFWVEQADPAPEQKIIPIGAVLTMAGTGSEMNGGSVITNQETRMKIGKVFGEELMPRFAVLNPRYTFSVPKRQMVAGIFDIMSHIMEQYFSGDDDSTSDYLAEGLMRSVIKSGRDAVKDPENYEARSNIMWSATWALNTLIGEGKTQDWEVHMLGHAISAYTDATHGMTLAAVFPLLLPPDNELWSEEVCTLCTCGVEHTGRRKDRSGACCRGYRRSCCLDQRNRGCFRYLVARRNTGYDRGNRRCHPHNDRRLPSAYPRRSG